MSTKPSQIRPKQLWNCSKYTIEWSFSQEELLVSHLPSICWPNFNHHKKWQKKSKFWVISSSKTPGHALFAKVKKNSRVKINITKSVGAMNRIDVKWIFWKNRDWYHFFNTCNFVKESLRSHMISSVSLRIPFFTFLNTFLGKFKISSFVRILLKKLDNFTFSTNRNFDSIVYSA